MKSTHEPKTRKAVAAGAGGKVQATGAAVRVRMVMDCYSLYDENGNEKLLREGWEGDRVRINGDRVTVKFDSVCPGVAAAAAKQGVNLCTLLKPVDVHVTKLEIVGRAKGKPE